MNTPSPFDPTTLSPLSYGAGLALGLMLLIGLPAESRPSRRSASPPADPDPGNCPAAPGLPRHGGLLRRSTGRCPAVTPLDRR